MRTIHVLLAGIAVIGWSLMFIDAWQIIETGKSIFPSLLNFF